jgi:hypothetical protein
VDEGGTVDDDNGSKQEVALPLGKLGQGKARKGQAGRSVGRGSVRARSTDTHTDAYDFGSCC